MPNGGGPWEDYTPATTEQSGPWEDYAKTITAPPALAGLEAEVAKYPRGFQQTPEAARARGEGAPGFTEEAGRGYFSPSTIQRTLFGTTPEESEAALSKTYADEAPWHAAVRAFLTGLPETTGKVLSPIISPANLSFAALAALAPEIAVPAALAGLPEAASAGVSGTFGAQGLNQFLTPKQPGETAAEEAQRATMGLAQAVGGAAGMDEAGTMAPKPEAELTGPAAAKAETQASRMVKTGLQGGEDVEEQFPQAKPYLQQIGRANPKSAAEAYEMADQWRSSLGNAIQQQAQRHPQIRISGDELANAVVGTIRPEDRKLFPEAVRQIEDEAERYRGQQLSAPETVSAASTLGAMKRAYFQAAPADRAAIEKASGSTRAIDRAHGAMVDTLAQYLEDAGETNAKQLRKDYGALRVLTDAFYNAKVQAGQTLPPSFKGSLVGIAASRPYLAMGPVAGTLFGRPVPESAASGLLLPAVAAADYAKQMMRNPEALTLRGLRALGRLPGQVPSYPVPEIPGQTLIERKPFALTPPPGAMPPEPLPQQGAMPVFPGAPEAVRTGRLLAERGAPAALATYGPSTPSRFINYPLTTPPPETPVFTGGAGLRPPQTLGMPIPIGPATRGVLHELTTPERGMPLEAPPPEPMPPIQPKQVRGRSLEGAARGIERIPRPPEPAPRRVLITPEPRGGPLARRVAPGTPLDTPEALRILSEAGGNATRALELARQRGYVIPKSFFRQQ